MTEKAQGNPDVPSMLDTMFMPFARSDQPGLVVGVAQHGRTIYRKGFGLACLKSGVANSPSTKMRIGSTTKHFTCILVLLLAGEGKLDLESGIRRYIPELPEAHGDPTLRQLMTHNGGIRDYIDLTMMSNGLAPIPVGMGLELQLAQRDVNFPAGERFIYCNGGYHLLSHAIMRVTGQSFEEALDERILRPMGMADTMSLPGDLTIVPDMATLHVPSPAGGWRQGLFMSEENLGEGAMISTIDDMLRWIGHLRRPTKIGSEAIWEQLKAPTLYPDGTTHPYGMGLIREEYRGVEVLHHGGAVIGGLCQMITVPHAELDIVIMTNGAPVDPIQHGFKVIDQILGADLAPLEETVRTEAMPGLVGTYYCADSGMSYDFADRDGELLFDPFNLLPYVRRRADGALIPGGSLFSGAVIRATTDGNPVAAIDVDFFGNADRAVRTPDEPPTAESMAHGLVGTYSLPDALSSATISFEQGALYLIVQGRFGRQIFSLTPLDTNVLRAHLPSPPIPNWATLSLARQADGIVSALRYNSARTRNMIFERGTS